MNRIVNTIAGRLSLRSPQRQSLEILDRVCEITNPKKDADLASVLQLIQSEFPSVQNFERFSDCWRSRTPPKKPRS